MNLVVSTMALARSPPDKQQCTEICFFFFFFLFSYTTRRQNSGESFGNSRIGEVPKKAQGKSKTSGADFNFFWRDYYLSGGKKGSIAQCDSL
jgi:hypothetical protein